MTSIELDIILPDASVLLRTTDTNAVTGRVETVVFKLEVSLLSRQCFPRSSTYSGPNPRKGEPADQQTEH